MRSWRWTVSRKLATLALAGLAIAGTLGVVSYVNVGAIAGLASERAQLVAADQQLRQLDVIESDLIIAKRDALLSFSDATATARAANGSRRRPRMSGQP